MSDEGSPLPPIHRVITYTDPSGKVQAIEDHVPTKVFAHGIPAAALYVQPDDIADPNKAVENTHAKPSGFIPSSGENVIIVGRFHPHPRLGSSS